MFSLLSSGDSDISACLCVSTIYENLSSQTVLKKYSLPLSRCTATSQLKKKCALTATCKKKPHFNRCQTYGIPQGRRD